MFILKPDKGIKAKNMGNIMIIDEKFKKEVNGKI